MGKLQSYTRNNHAFSGGASFMSNGYVVYRNGLNGQAPNWYGVKQGETYAERMFYTRSGDVRASFNKFITHLRAVQQKEKAKEQRYIAQKLTQLRASIPEDYYLKIEKAFEDENYSLVFTLLTQQNQDLKELNRELNSNHFNNISHMNSFWANQFSAFVNDAFNNKLEIKNHQLVSAIIDNENTSIASLVDEFFAETISSDNVLAASLDSMKEKFKNELLGYLHKKGIVNDKFGVDDNLFTDGRTFTSLIGRKTTQKQRTKGSKVSDKELSSVTRAAADAIGNAVARGMSSEKQGVQQMSKLGGNAITIGTGDLKKELRSALGEQGYTVNQKGDVTTFEIFDGSFDIASVVKESWEQAMKRTSGQMDVIRDKVLAAASQTQADEIFEITQNIKGYRSKRNLQIEGEGSFRSRINNLRLLSNTLPKNSVQQLVFMLNNCVEGALNENRQKYVAQYIAAVCAAWMFDDYEEMYSLENLDSRSTTKIHIFNSGGIYYTASGIMDTVINSLLYQASDPNSLIAVEINGVTLAQAENMYESLRKKYPVSYDSYAAFDSALTNRWNEMRDWVENKSLLKISVKQNELERIVDNLRILL